MVGDGKWEQWMTTFCKPFTKAKVMYFDKSHIDAAWKWLQENEEEKDQPPDAYDDYDKRDGYRRGLLLRRCGAGFPGSL